ncbi:hypothetical protein [Larkinella punicea]|uniref:Uncharacterized protein n=1 Tax=Larkinella punicea TaxID=2315727 RepID=A0A368JUW0_9BACT|nr:hypothetical protein [Larkinella punicea]RCR71145.1 hypothetical protein DUE52_02530 [Larkinella punicea]
MTNDVQYQTGKMVKDPRKMNPKERIQWQKQCAQNARDYLFSINQPLVYKRPDGHTVAEYKNGQILVVR